MRIHKQNYYIPFISLSIYNLRRPYIFRSLIIKNDIEFASRVSATNSYVPFLFSNIHINARKQTKSKFHLFKKKTQIPSFHHKTFYRITVGSIYFEILLSPIHMRQLRNILDICDYSINIIIIINK